MLNSKIWQSSQNILFYWPLKYEINLKNLIKSAFDQSKKCYLPKAYSKGNKLICTHSELRSLEQELFRGQFGNMECAGLGLESSSPTSSIIDLVFVPALMFDRKGYRLGRGLGFYDRLIAQLPSKVITIGVIPESLFVEKLDFIDEWDKPVHNIITEKKLTKIIN